MTLFKQIIIILSFFQTVILSVVMWQNFNTANEFVQTQLKFDAMHTANSLGLSITPAVSQNDIATIETMINSMFDSGYFEMISLVDTKGETIVKNYQPTIIADVPSWFVKLIDMKAPIANSNVMAGWIPYGTLQVQNSTGLAYRQLWNTVKDIGLSFLIISLITFIILHQSLKFILNPLKKVQQQAEAISQNDFIFQKEVPSTIELKQVVTAMNTMTSKVQEIFNKEAQTVKKYHELLYKDRATNLYNRRYFVLKLQEYLKSEEESVGSVIFASFTNQKKLKSEIGYKRSEELISKLGEAIDKNSKVSQLAVSSSMKEGDFAILIPALNSQKTKELCETLSQNLSQIIQSFGLDINRYFFNFGATKYEEKVQVSDILSKADFALSNAKTDGASKIYWHEDNENEIALGKEAWNKELLDAIETKRLIFAMQRAQSIDGDIYHNEIFLRLKDKNGAIYNAGYFMPMVKELKLNSKIDHYVVRTTLEMLKNNEFPPSSLSINIGKDTLLETSEASWLESILPEFRDIAKGIINFEFATRGEIPIAVLANISKKLRKYNFGLGLDNFMPDGDSLKVLQSINPTYIKVHASTLIDLFTERESESSKQSLDIITETMDIKIIAMGVETQKSMEQLQKIGIKYMQGSFIEEPYFI